MPDPLALFPLAIIALLLVAAWYDIATRLIPDLLPALIALLGLALRAPLGPGAVAASVAVALLLFVLVLPAASRGAFGGGDVKLCTALALGLSPLASWHFVFTTVMVGGALGLAYLAAPHLLGPSRLAPAGSPLLRRIMLVEHRRLRRRGPLPYAVAIACGGIVVHFLPPGG